MSTTVIDSGKLVPVRLDWDEAEAECARLGIDNPGAYSSPHLALTDETNEYAFIDGLGLCRVENFHTEEAGGTWCQLIEHSDGSILFKASYYNGGAHWTELVEEKLNR